MNESGLAALGIGSILLGLVIVLLPAIFYCLTLQNALKKVRPFNRTMSPGQVWLLFIPLFNIIWHFIVISKMSSSLHNEFASRNMMEDNEPGKTLGLTFCILSILSVIPILGIICAIASFICFIVYWVKIAGFSRKLDLPFEAVNPQNYQEAPKEKVYTEQ
jgi:hypothetical protein